MAFIEDKYKVQGKRTIPFQRVYILANQVYANDVRKKKEGMSLMQIYLIE